MARFPNLADLNAALVAGALYNPVPEVASYGTHVSDVDADGPFFVSKTGGTFRIHGRFDLDISADLVNEGFKFTLPDGLDPIACTGVATIVNPVGKSLVASPPAPVTTAFLADGVTVCAKVTFESIDGGGATTNIKVCIDLAGACAGAEIPAA